MEQQIQQRAYEVYEQRGRTDGYDLDDWLQAERLYREALPDLNKYSALSRGHAASLALLGYAHARLGERNEALHMIEELRALEKRNFVPAFSFALVYAGLEDKDQAFTWLEKSCDERFNRLAYVKVEALWDPLRSDPRFADLLRRIGLPQ